MKLGFNSLNGVILLVCLLCSSCEQRFWYRHKVKREPVKMESSKGKVDIDIENLSPEFVSRRFENTIRMAALRKLYKLGFTPTGKDTPDYLITIILRVDSYYVYKSRYNMFSKYPTQHLVRATRENLQSMREFNSLLELTFKYYMQAYKKGYTCWQSDDGLYFFNDETKDISRSVGMVKYALSNVP